MPLSVPPSHSFLPFWTLVAWDDETSAVRERNSYRDFVVFLDRLGPTAGLSSVHVVDHDGFDKACGHAATLTGPQDSFPDATCC